MKVLETAFFRPFFDLFSRLPDTVLTRISSLLLYQNGDLVKGSLFTSLVLQFERLLQAGFVHDLNLDSFIPQRFNLLQL